MSKTPSSRLIEKTVAVGLLLLLFFASPLLGWWSQSGLPWFTPYLLWLAVIILTALVQIRSNKHDL